MKIHYELKYFLDRKNFVEPDRPKLLKEIGTDKIFSEIVRNTIFLCAFHTNFMEELLVEQRCVLHNHAFIIATQDVHNFSETYYREIQLLLEQEIEPGVFRR
jgi:hypothetical protein